MISLCVKLMVRAIINFPGSHGFSIIKNLLALPILECLYAFLYRTIHFYQPVINFFNHELALNFIAPVSW